MKKKLALLVLGICWLGALTFVQAKVRQYNTTPGVVSTLRQWPQGVGTPADEGVTLVLLAHPQCPCTRATLTELTEVVQGAKNKPALKVLFYKPATEAPGWEKTDLWKRVNALPNIESVVDVDGKLAREFGLHTSGEIAVYDAQGAGVFQGGITISRGHVGDNPGKAAVTALVNSGRTSISTTPVYGCVVVPGEQKPVAKRS